MTGNIREQVRNGLRLGLGAVFGTLVMILLVYGVSKLRFPEADDSLFTFLKAYPSWLVGGLSSVAALAVLWFTLDRWAKLLPGLFAYAVFGGLLAVAAGGFHSHIASLQLTRFQSAIMSALYLLCSLLTLGFARGELRWADRAAAMCAPLLLTFAATSNHAITGFRILALLVAVFATTAAYDHFWWPRQSKTGVA